MVHELPRRLFVSLVSLNHLKSRNLAFYSTNVVEVTGTWLVIKTGDETVMGCIAGLVATLDSGKTPINKEVD